MSKSSVGKRRRSIWASSTNKLTLSPPPPPSTTPTHRRLPATVTSSPPPRHHRHQPLATSTHICSPQPADHERCGNATSRTERAPATTSTVPSGRAASSDGDDVHRRHRLHSFSDVAMPSGLTNERRPRRRRIRRPFVLAQVSPLAPALFTNTRTRCHVTAIGDVAIRQRTTTSIIVCRHHTTLLQHHHHATTTTTLQQRPPTRQSTYSSTESKVPGRYQRPGNQTTNDESSFVVVYIIARVSTPSTLNPTHPANYNTTHPETTVAITTPPPPHDTDEYDDGACGNQTANNDICRRS
ncbi:hypothetical protein K443DRAFT_4049 [Laccaria amethystina LaAM-08-1]|uniref:Uncharacterized protein n=1 Tax=Laccaria amethystina LaAM-08-1 TaxID=1095629 RepID=A0A0C9Y4Z1_9AGAR|nr:hypothetical protein K443DRAFT_4049 [Laccaria amethystina LaAM-08-1]